ncbi:MULTISPECIES: GNAT family N-acetyltransferase [Bosea]|jgi:RimJ/RimL family protein N-acetyltransferase|uniref:Protein N-acetyltransferase, RimJ/RimL family n=1 Tax=Bosea robiniae TaxID=1036780 RepID=A0ABY0NFL4_9HYPH|nr:MULTISPECIES: GNAT family N-acetyltransferase [Bosea]TQI76357.1 RimJ/RimL family protein N-acetyltransferase [Bosea sp. AK1]SDF39605.1 Protein N-acetyltransferase, RimJ/RimL family [Bosea robiniae]
MIETENLRLRRPEIGDLEAIHAMRSDLAIVRFLGGRALNREEAWHRLTRIVGHWALRGYGMFAVVEKRSGALVGEVGLFDGCRGLSPDFDNAPEAGWILAGEAQGKGYAGEAAAAAHRWFAAAHGEQRSVCIIAPENLASFRVAHKLGYKSFGQVDYQNGPVVMLERIPG